MTSKPFALVIGEGVNALGVTRSLGEMKIPVITLSAQPKAVALFSKYCIGQFRPVVYSQKQLVSSLLKLGKNLNEKAVLFCAGSDGILLTVAKHREELEKHYELPIPEIEILDILVNKKKFCKQLQKIGIPHPKTYFGDEHKIEQIAREVIYPCIVKPVYSHRFNEIFKAKGLMAHNRKELIQNYSKARAKRLEVMIQELIPGDATHMHCFAGYFNRNSQPIAVFTYRRIRQWPFELGNGCLLESKLVPTIVKLGTKFLQTIRYHGIIDAEFKKDPRDNRFKLLEINARSWLQNRLATRCGVNIPYIAYKDILGEPMKPTKLRREGVKWLALGVDIRASLYAVLQRKLNPLQWLNSLRGEKEYALFSKRDPAPFAKWVFNVLDLQRARVMLDVYQ